MKECIQWYIDDPTISDEEKAEKRYMLWNSLYAILTTFDPLEIDGITTRSAWVGLNPPAPFDWVGDSIVVQVYDLDENLIQSWFQNGEVLTRKQAREHYPSEVLASDEDVQAAKKLIRVRMCASQSHGTQYFLYPFDPHQDIILHRTTR